MATIFLEGGERGVAPLMVAFSGSWVPVTNTTAAYVRKDPSGEGGSYGLKSANVGGSNYEGGAVTLPVRFREGWISAGVYTQGTPSYESGLGVRDTDFAVGSSVQWSVYSRFDTSEISSYRSYGSGRVLLDSAAGIVGSTHQLWEIHFFIDNTAGFVHLYLDGSLVSTFEGDTQNLGTNSANAICLLWRYSGFAEGAGWDDIVFNVPSIAYKTGVGGLPETGDTITDGTTGATAEVVDVFPGSDGTSGRIVLCKVLGSFGNGNAITTTTGTGTLNALVDAPTAAHVDGLEPNSGRAGNGYIVYRTATGAGATTGLTATGAATNWEAVDNVPLIDNGEYVSSNVPDTYDTYVHADLPASAVIVKNVETITLAAKDGTGIEKIQHVIHDGVSTIFSPDYSLPTSYGFVVHDWLVDPHKNATWTVADVNAYQFGPRVRS